MIPSVRSETIYEGPESNLWKKAVVMSSAGKDSLGNKYWFDDKGFDDN